MLRDSKERFQCWVIPNGKIRWAKCVQGHRHMGHIRHLRGIFLFFRVFFFFEVAFVLTLNLFVEKTKGISDRPITRLGIHVLNSTLHSGFM
jgi:hypothetical protein